MAYNLFISHSWSYSNTYADLVRLLDNASNFTYRNYSVPKDSPIHNAPSTAGLRNAIATQMGYASVVIVLAGVYASYSKWIDVEIDLAKNAFQVRKKILAIEPWGAERTSQLVKTSADKIVSWNTSSIVAAIRELG